MPQILWKFQEIYSGIKEQYLMKNPLKFQLLGDVFQTVKFLFFFYFNCSVILIIYDYNQHRFDGMS